MIDMEKSFIVVLDSLRKPQSDYKELIDMLNRFTLSLHYYSNIFQFNRNNLYLFTFSARPYAQGVDKIPQEVPETSSIHEEILRKQYLSLQATDAGD